MIVPGLCQIGHPAELRNAGAQEWLEARFLSDDFVSRTNDLRVSITYCMHNRL